jgi:hypothetical protein
MSIIRTLSKMARYLGILLLALGMLVTAYAVYNIISTQDACEGGLSPRPAQGCGYVPELVMFHWSPNDQYPIIILGLYIMYAGIAVLVIRWVAVHSITKSTLK